MDENKINPELENSEEMTEVPVQEIQETEVKQDETTEEKVESVNDETETVEEPVEEEVVISEEKPKKKKQGKIVALVVLILLIVGATVAMFAVVNSNINGEDKVLSVGDYDSNVGEFINVYSMYSYYASYYNFTADQVKEYTLEELETVNTYYAKAIDAGYELTDEEIAEIDENVKSVTTQAETYSMSTEQYLEEYICKNYTMDMYRNYLEKQYLAQRYYTDNLEKIDTELENDSAAVQTKYDSVKTDNDICNVSYWYFDSTDDDAKTKASAIVADVKGGKSFDEAIKSVTGDSKAVSNKIVGRIKSVVSSNFSSDAANWIFSAKDGKYENGKGAITTIESNGVVYVLYVNAEPCKNESVPVTLNYIKVAVGTDTTVKSEDELKVTAKATANKILKEFESGEVTAEAFSKLSTTYGNNDDSLVTADVFSEITADGTNDASIEAWAFDSARKVGDYALIECDGCYYIVFYASKNENAVWYQTALDLLKDDAYEKWADDVKAEYKDKIVVYDDVIEKVVTYLSTANS